MESHRQEQKRSKRQELLRRLNEAEELSGTQRREPGAEESKNAYELELELQRQRNWRASVGASWV